MFTPLHRWLAAGWRVPTTDNEPAKTPDLTWRSTRTKRLSDMSKMRLDLHYSWQTAEPSQLWRQLWNCEWTHHSYAQLECWLNAQHLSLISQRQVPFLACMHPVALVQHMVSPFKEKKKKGNFYLRGTLETLESIIVISFIGNFCWKVNNGLQNSYATSRCYVNQASRLRHCLMPLAGKDGKKNDVWRSRNVTRDQSSVPG